MGEACRFFNDHFEGARYYLTGLIRRFGEGRGLLHQAFGFRHELRNRALARFQWPREDLDLRPDVGLDLCPDVGLDLRSDVGLDLRPGLGLDLRSDSQTRMEDRRLVRRVA